MQKINIWDMQFIPGRKIGFLLIGLLLAAPLFSQVNLYDHDDQAMYFGISMGMNYSDLITRFEPTFPIEDTVLVIDNKLGPGFQIGIVSNLKLTKRLAIKFVPQLIFAEKQFDITTFDNVTFEEQVENIYLGFPFHLKYKSDRWGNFRLYSLTGIKFLYDLNSNARNRKSTDLIKATNNDLSIEIGLGASIFFSNFVLAPEIKYGQGVLNVHAKDNDIAQSRVIKSLRSRHYTFTLGLEGGGKLFKRKKNQKSKYR